MRASITLAITLAVMLAIVVGAASAADVMVVDRSTRNKSVNDYVFLTRDAIQRAWTIPVVQTGAAAVKGHVSINYAVTRSGALESVQLIQGSGNEEMDRTLLEAIRKAAPFPPFPDEVAAGKLFIRAKFVVADLPTVPVTTVDHKVNEEDKPTLITPDDARQAMKWGIPAETSSAFTGAANAEMPPRPPFKKYQWGAEK